MLQEDFHQSALVLFQKPERLGDFVEECLEQERHRHLHGDVRDLVVHVEEEFANGLAVDVVTAS